MVLGALQQLDRIGHQTLLAGVGVGDPQAVHRVVAGPAPQEQHSTTIRGHADVARLAQAEATCSGVLARKGVGHT
jgi:hypothetical protein